MNPAQPVPAGRLLYADRELSVFERAVLVEGRGALLLNARTQVRLVQSRGPVWCFYAGWLVSLIGLAIATLGPAGFGWVSAGVVMMGSGAHVVRKYHARCLQSLVLEADGLVVEIASRSPALDEDAAQLDEARLAVSYAVELLRQADHGDPAPGRRSPRPATDPGHAVAPVGV